MSKTSFEWNPRHPTKDTPQRSIPKTDSIVDSIIDKFVERAAMGKEKYGTDLDRTDLDLIDYINHALEEHMDAILYLQKVKKMLETKNP
jgi:hypothetical protein